MFGLIPFKMNRVYKEDVFDNFLSEFFNDDFFDMSNINGSFKADIRETDNEYLVEAELPGVKKEDIELEYENNNLIISAKRDEFVEDNNNNFIRKERHYGNFLRSFYVENVDREGIQGRFKDGLLQIIMPKIERKTNRNKRINIQ